MPLALSTIKTLASAAQPGLWAHGGGLCLVVARGRASWAFRYSIAGKRRLMVVEPYEPISAPKLKALELTAESLRQQVRAGRDPLAERDAIGPTVPAKDTFEDFARNYVETQKAGWRGTAYAKQWKQTLKDYAYPIIGAKRPHEITTDDVLSVLRQPYKGRPFWEARTVTASVLRGRIETIIGAAKAKGLSDAKTRALWEGHRNPAAWSDNLEYWLKTKKDKKHFAAMDYRDVPALAQELSTKDDFKSCCLLFGILCAVRASGAPKSLWLDFDIDAGVWTIPGERMKAGKPHSIPLATQAVELLKRLPRFVGVPLVFPGGGNRTIGPDTLLKYLHNLAGTRFTVHGFRSAFRDWAADTTLHPDPLVKAALAHTLTDRVDAAYRRKTAFDRRKLLMQQWADYLLTNEKDYQAKWKAFLALDMAVHA